MTKTWQQFSATGGSWGQYKDYLAMHGAMSPELIGTPSITNRPRDKKLGKRVIWSGLMFHEVENLGLLGEVELHISTKLSEDKVSNYMQFLADKAGFPHDWVEYMRGLLRDKKELTSV